MTDYSKKLLILGKGISGSGLQKFTKAIHMYNDDELEGKNFDEIEYVYVSPGIDLDIKPELVEFIKNWKIVSDFDILYEYNPRAIFIGVTGSAGKTSTCYKLKYCFDQLGIPCNFGGNMGLDIFEKPDAPYHILEVSSFQLIHMSKITFDRALITNIIPTHLDRHKSFEVYRQLKYKILKIDYNKPQRFFINSNNIQTSTSMALEIMNSFGFNNCNLDNFQELPHRQELCYEDSNIKIINDSKATTDISVEFAIQNFKDCGPITLVIGGVPKSQTIIEELKEMLKYVEKIYCFGVHREFWADLMKNNGVNNINSIETIDELPLDKIRGVLLFSPLGASFDQFSSYIKRGEYFKTFVKNYFNK